MADGIVGSLVRGEAEVGEAELPPPVIGEIFVSTGRTPVVRGAKRLHASMGRIITTGMAKRIIFFPTVAWIGLAAFLFEPFTDINSMIPSGDPTDNVRNKATPQVPE
jgi:hypothetical protein